MIQKYTKINLSLLFKNYVIVILSYRTSKISSGNPKMYDPVFKLKKHQIVLENEGQSWKSNTSKLSSLSD